MEESYWLSNQCYDHKQEETALFWCVCAGRGKLTISLSDVAILWPWMRSLFVCTLSSPWFFSEQKYYTLFSLSRVTAFSIAKKVFWRETFNLLYNQKILFLIMLYTLTSVGYNQITCSDISVISCITVANSVITLLSVHFNSVESNKFTVSFILLITISRTILFI